MMKDRFGGLYSVLNKRDVQTLRDFDHFLESVLNTYEIGSEGKYDKQAFPLPERAMVPDLGNLYYIYFGYHKDEHPFRSKTLGPDFSVEILKGSIQDIYTHYNEIYQELYRQCNEPGFSGRRPEGGAKFGPGLHYQETWLGDEVHPGSDKASDLAYRDVVIRLKHQCRIWLNKLDPIIRKLKRESYRLTNTELA